MIKIRSLRYYVLLSLLLFLPFSSCGPKYKAARAQRQTEKRLEQRKKEGEKAMLKGKENHLKAQSKETRRRMKETRKRSKRLNKNRKIPFYKRWYNAIRKR